MTAQANGSKRKFQRNRKRTFRALLLAFVFVPALCNRSFAQTTANTPVFGPQTYTRTTGAPNEYTTTFTAPPWIVSPYNLHIVNGDASGNNRVSSAVISLNGVQIAGQSDFNENIATIDRNVTLQSTNTLQVTLDSKPGSFITINASGTNGDHTGPQLTIATPANNGFVKTGTPDIQVTYSDPVGAGEPAASGINTSTFTATLDGVDKTSLFTARTGDASATIPANMTLAPGAHTLSVSITDNAGNQTSVASQFTVDLIGPQLQILQPVSGSYLNLTTPTISIQYSDNDGVDPASLKVLLNGTDITALFSKTGSGATATLTSSNSLPQGANQVVVQVQDLAGNQASASVPFNVDTTRPTISIVHPVAGSYHGSSTVEATVQYSDDQALDISTLNITIDGSPLSASSSATGATATAVNLSNGPHTVATSIKDKAGNLASAQIPFYVDTAIPTVHVDQPAPGALLKNPAPTVTIDYSDPVGVDTTTFHVLINGTDYTTFFTVGPASASAQLAGQLVLPDGQNTISAQIANLATTQGAGSSTFTVDTVPPTIGFASPSAVTNNPRPTVTVSYSDSTSGVDLATVKVSLDGSDVTAFLAAGPTSATGALQLSQPLSDGAHQLTAVISDRAGNKSQTATLPFVIDTKPPIVTFSSPTDNSFTNNPTPSIVVQYGDGTGAGIDPSSVRIILQQGTNPPSDITAYFQIASQQATGTIPASVTLADDTYVLTAVVGDRAGNQGTAHATFVVDTIAPTGAIQAPAANAIFNASTVSVVLTYQDDRSGVDTTKLVLTVDGIDRSSVVTPTATQATGTLSALPDGVHGIQFTVFDRAGNSVNVAAQPFTIDTSVPTILASVTPAPNATGWNKTDVTVAFSCNDTGSGVASCPPPVAVATEGANQSFCGVATDSAGNSSPPACATVKLDKTPPTISATVSPAPGSNGINTTTPVTISFSCADNLSGIASCPGLITVTTLGLNQVFSGTAIDNAGNGSLPATVTVNIQTAAPTPPSITASVSPAANSKGWNNTSVTVTFSCAAGSNPLATCSSPVVVSAEGANQSVCGQAIDTAGLSSSVCPKVSLDLTPPSIAISTQPLVNPNGWFTSPVSVTFACSDALSGVATCPPPQQFSADGANQSITGTATDNAGNTATPASYKINIDQTLPSILQFSSPTQLAPGQSATATVSATDNIGVASVVFQLNGTTISTLLGPPYTASFTIPGTANAGDTVTLTVVVSDLAGNANSSSRGIQVVAAGVVVGQVLSDVNGLPFEGATVQVVGGDDDDTSDDNGRYSIPVDNSHLFLSISTVANLSTGVPATVPVEREVSVQTGVGTVPIDARLTPVGPGIPIGPAGGTLTSGSLTISIPAGAISATTSLHLTTLSQQGLPGLLPLGWSPITAFDLRADSSTSAAANANFSQLPNALTLDLVAYDYSAHAWKMVTPNLGAVNGALTIPLASLGNYALVSTDIGNTSVVIPSAGQPLAGVTMVALPASTTASGSLNPASVAPTGGTSAATLAVLSPTPLPSGTVIQANVTESYSLTSGKQLSGQRRTEDILVYQVGAPSGATAAATFPVTPSESFQIGEVSAGNVHLDLLSGRESVRGQVGGNDAATIQGGDATLTVAAGSLPKNTAVSVSPEGLDNFLPTTTNLTPLAEYNVDLSGQTLTTAAQLSVAAGTAQTGDNIFLVQVLRISGAPYLVVVGQAQVNGANLVTLAAPGLSGIAQGGDFVFYKLSSPTGFVSGTVTTSSGPVAALVQTDGLPFVIFANFAGSYVIPALTGTVNLTASVPNTALAGTGSAQVIAGQTAAANLTVVGQIESATVTPPNGAVGVPLTAEIDIAAADAFNQATVTAANVTLTQTGQGSNVPVPVRFVFSQGGTKVAVFPLTALQPSTTYTVAASGLANGVGGLIAVPTVSFTTQAITPPNFNIDALVFAMPDQNGNVAISAPANSFPPGTTILIVDQTNGVVISLTVGNDGSVSGQMPATIDDVLAVTITAPDKTTVSFTRSKFVAPDGTTAIGPGGGTITSADNIAMIIPNGALNKGATFKLDLLDQTAFPQLPMWPGANFGSGIKITAPAMPSFNKEVKLAFPVPVNAPQGAFYYVYRRLVDPNDSTKVLFETVDHAFVQGTGASAQVVTASPPFCGYMNSFGNFQAIAAASYQPLQTAITFTFMMWDYDPNQAGVASQGLIAGRVFQNDASGNAGPLLNDAVATITLTDNPQYVTTTVPACGTYSLFDPQRGGGSRSITATATLPTYDPTTGNTTTQKQTIVDTANEVNGAQPNDSLFSVTAGLYNQYRDIGRLNFTFSPATPPPPPPQISIRLFTLDANNNNLRVPVSGILQTGTQLVIAFKSNLTVQSASINGTPLPVIKPDVGDTLNGVSETRLLDARVQGFYPVGNSGTYTITASAVNPLTLAPASVSISVLVVAAGGGNNSVIFCAPTAPATAASCTLPQVVSVSPENGATSVPPSVFPQVTFSEPVKNVSIANVVLKDSSGTTVPVQFLGVRPDGSVANPVQPSDTVTSITIQPTVGLKFNQTYSLTLNAKNTSGCLDSNGHPYTTNAPDGSALIVDTNTSPSGPLCMPPFPTAPSGSSTPLPYNFTTFGPQDLGGTASQYAVLTRPVIIGQRGYAGEFVGVTTSGVGTFDLSDPSNPKDLGVGASFVGRVIDVAGQQNSPVTGRGLLAFSAGAAEDLSIPGNVWLYDVPSDCANTQAPPTCPAPNRVGAVSVSSSATQAGIATRLVMKDNYLYTFTFLQGLQVVNLGQAISEYQQVYGTNPTQFGQAVSTEGNGFAMDAVVNTIPLPNPSGGTYVMYGLAADDFATSSSGSATSTQTLLVATGQVPVVIADPTLSGASAVVYPSGSLSTTPLQMTSADGQTTYQLLLGRAVALGAIPMTDSNGNTINKHIGVVVGSGKIGPTTNIGSSPVVSVLAVFDMSQVYSTGQPFAPNLIGMLALVDQNGNLVSGIDVKLNGSVALVATGSNIILVNLENPRQPIPAGQITGSFGNWVATNPSGQIIGSANAPISGIQVSSLGIFGTMLATPNIMLADANYNSADDIQFQYRISGDLSQVADARIDIEDDDGNTLSSIPVPVKTSGTAVLPAGLPIEPTPISMSVKVINSDGTASLPFDVQPEIVGGGAPTPVITATSPARIHAGCADTTIAITGRNFLPSTVAVIAQTVDFSSSNTLSPLYVNGTQLNVTFTADHCTSSGTWNLFLLNSGVHSNVVTIKVVPPGLPPAPALTAVIPVQLPETDSPQDTWITLQGNNFVEGDTIVTTSYSSEPLTYKVVSPSQISLLIPAVWQIYPLQAQLIVSSIQDSDLHSEAQTLEVPNTLGIAVLPPVPQIATVNNGFVALANSASDQPITIQVQGSQFDQGAQLQVTIDGQDVPLPPISVTPTFIQAQLPADLWRNLSNRARLRVTLSGTITPGRGQLLVTTDLPKQKVKFEKATPDNFHGFHSRHFQAKHSEEYFLSVAPDGRNNVNAKLPDKHYLRAGVTVTYDGGPFPLQATPQLAPPAQPAEVVQASAQQQTLTINGIPSNGILPLDTLYPLLANRTQTVNGQTSTAKIGVLGTQSMPPRQFRLVVHFVGNGNTNNASQQPTLVPERSKQSLNWLLAGINTIWTPQANVSFTIQLPTNESQTPGQVSYHVDKVLYDTNADGTVETTEQSIIDQALATPNRGISRKLFGEEVPGSNDTIDIYFVKKFDAARQARLVFGQAVDIGQHGLFVSDAGGSGNALLQILAHEIGHTIGLHHNANSNGSGQCNVVSSTAPVNPFIDYGRGDSDFKDNSSLMWCFVDPDRKHIGAPLWFELNAQNPLP
jgi:hypothetical protein